MTIKTATWNIRYDTPLVALQQTAVTLVTQKVGLLFCQETANRADFINTLHEHYDVVFHGDCLIGWDPNLWTHVVTENINLSKTPYYRVNGNPVILKSPKSILSDRYGRTLNLMSYHLPSHTQTKTPPKNRVTATKEAFQTMRTLTEQSETRAIIFAGDDNIDETRPHAITAPTGLTQIVAPTPTNGNRRIDDYRVKGVIAGQGTVLPTSGDHRVHIREFQWKK